MKVDILRVVYIAGVIGVIIGALDPLEGSVIIAIGSVLLAVATWFKNDIHRKIFLATAIGIVCGVILLFVFSDMGGFGKDAPLAWGWSLLIAPYPLGWLAVVLLLIYRLIKKIRLGEPVK